MKNEIDKDFYCSGNFYTEGGYCHFLHLTSGGKCLWKNCTNYHSKHPTPEQFREEYGEEYPDEGAVYIGVDCGDSVEILTVELQQVQDKKTWRYTFGDGKNYPIVFLVCACTPFGKPPANWRPA